MARDYNAAVKCLNTLQTNFATLKAVRDSATRPYARAIPEMDAWCRRLGYKPPDFDHLNLIHISGTKGKGSTSVFVSSILSQYPSLVPKVGLYTSPHLRTVRERIQLNNAPISPSLFAKYFFESWDRIEASTYTSDYLPPPPEKAHPNYFRFLTLAALHAFHSEKVSTAILECGIGGEYDSTNIISSPTVTAITSLGLDHLDQLGRRIEDIAWHKAGIFKAASPWPEVYTTAAQLPSALSVLRQRAEEKGKQLRLVPVHPQIASKEVPLGLEGEFQKHNASLAVAIASAFLKQRSGLVDPSGEHIPYPGSTESLPRAFRSGLAAVRWKGRCETRQDLSGKVTWYLDGAHTRESVPGIAAWFVRHALHEHVSTAKRVLVFNQQTRDAGALLRSLYAAVTEELPKGLRPFTHAVFCTNAPYKASGRDDGSLNSSTEDKNAVEALTVQRSLAREMRTLDQQCEVDVVGSVEDAVARVRRIEGGRTVLTPVLVTGSLHLVGAFTEVLESEEEERG